MFYMFFEAQIVRVLYLEMFMIMIRFKTFGYDSPGTTQGFLEEDPNAA